MKVPFFDLSRQYEHLKSEMARVIDEVMESQAFILGKKGRDLEESFCSLLGTADAIGVASGSDALLLSLIALGVGKDDEVITTPFSFFATASCIARVGARPVFADIDQKDYNIDPEGVRACITGKTKAILPVHLFGQCADMGALQSIGAENNVPILEDAAQAICSSCEGAPAGSMGILSAFSFYPTKNLGACGDGGLIATQDAALGETIRMLRNQGSSPKYFHPLLGVNSRLDEIQASILHLKMGFLEEWTSKRRSLAENYRALFRSQGLDRSVGLPEEKEGYFHTYHQFVVRVPDRDQLRAFLMEQGIGTEIYYPLPLHLQKCFENLGYKKGDFPHTEQAAQEVLALPVFPELTAQEQEAVVKGIGAFYEEQ